MSATTTRERSCAFWKRTAGELRKARDLRLRLSGSFSSPRWPLASERARLSPGARLDLGPSGCFQLLPSDTLGPRSLHRTPIACSLGSFDARLSFDIVLTCFLNHNVFLRPC